MRFDRLDILRYGALTDRTLEFRSNAKLHIVYGANEAGKSSALKAISDLLFGFPHEVEQAFTHDASTLRVAAEISARNGNRLQFRRRRGRKNTLLAHSDQEAPLADDALAAFLGAMGRPVFERAFGLDTDRLRTGAAAMLQSGGEIGSLLFSAASGLTGLTNLRRSLDNDAEGIFAQRRSKDRLFYQALERHEEARKSEREHELKSGDWKRLVEQGESSAAALAALQAQRLEKRREHSRLTALRNLEPLMREIDADEAAVAVFQDIEPLADTEERLDAASDAHRQAVEKESLARGEVLRLRDALSVAQVDEGLFAAAGKIIERYAGKSAYLSAKADIARVRGEVDDFDLRLGQLMRKLGLDVDVAQLEILQPTDAVLAQLQQLKEIGRELRRAHSEIERNLARERAYLRDLESIYDGPQPVDPRQHADRLTALQAELGDIARIDGLQVRVDRARSELDDGIGRLSPAISSLDQIVAVPLPDVSTLSDHRRLIDAASAVVRDVAGQLAGAVSEAHTVSGEMARLEGGDVIVTRDEIMGERKLRDNLWREFAAAPAPAARVGVEAAMSQADRLADLALANAERVARHTHLQLRSTELVKTQERLEAEAQEAKQKLGALEADYRALFALSGVSPLGCEQMIEWRRAIDVLAGQRAATNVLADELSVLRLSEERIAPVLADIARDTGLSDARALPCAALGKALARHLDAMEQRWSESRATEGKRTSSLESIRDLETEAEALTVRTERWQLEFSDVTSELGLGEGATIEMAEAILEVWKQVPLVLAERANRDRRVKGMARDITAFEESISALTTDVAPDLAQLSADAAIDMLHQRAVAESAEQQRRVRLVSDLGIAELSQGRYEQEALRCASILSELTSSLPPNTDPAALLQRMRDRRSAQSSLAASRRRFVEQANGLSESDVRAQLAGFDRAEASLAVEQLDREDAELVARLGDVTAEVAENKRKRHELETAKSVEYAVFERLSAEEETKDLARQWVVLKLAARMLATSMEAYREAQSDPVITRAGALFSTLTEGAFGGLAQEYGEDDTLHLAAVRSGGERVPLPGLSEGTGDQLYLALRLAFIEDYCSRNEPAPLIIDDIFQTFDDDRTRSGLKALASTSDVFQTILFTHQASVVDIARRALADEVDVITM
ncbi:YhaN family protein [Rhizobium sp. 18055]|uniref:ATP-binding protein n=1 Tax=Rhizobium sp. 18055 TaxID=2681403 RepID=UPI001357991A|nr:YhaN family protein [Rhizobium sp. 18055]